MTRHRALLLLAALPVLSQTPAYKVGDRVEAYDIGWYKGVITQIGSGSMQGYYMVKYDDYTTQRYFKPDSLRPGGPPSAPKTYPAYNVGDRVEGYDLGWYAARVTQIRQGKDAPEYLLQYEKYSSTRWYHPKDMRSATVAETAGQGGPRLGVYPIYSFGAAGAPPIYLGHFELLAGGMYRISRSSGGPYYGEGAYRFNAGASRIEWISGPLASPEWGGDFRVEGNRHRVALRSRTIATNG